MEENKDNIIEQTPEQTQAEVQSEPVVAPAPESAPAPAPTPAPAPAPAPTEIIPPKGSRYAVYGTWRFIGTLILLAIPLVGFILTCMWAFSSHINLNKRNFARAILILNLLMIALFVFLIVSFWAVVSSSINDAVHAASGGQF